MKGAGEGSTLALGTHRLGFPCWKKLPQQWGKCSGKLQLQSQLEAKLLAGSEDEMAAA